MAEYVQSMDCYHYVNVSDCSVSEAKGAAVPISYTVQISIRLTAPFAIRPHCFTRLQPWCFATFDLLHNYTITALLHILQSFNAFTIQATAVKRQNTQ